MSKNPHLPKDVRRHHPNDWRHSCELREGIFAGGLSIISFQKINFLIQFSSVTQSCPTLCDPMNRSTPGLLVHHQLPEPIQTHVHWAVMPSSHLILYRPLLLLPSIFPSIRVFSSESALRIRWPKYWSFSFNISPSNYVTLPKAVTRKWKDNYKWSGKKSSGRVNRTKCWKVNRN